jgi:hypothetical protein
MKIGGSDDASQGYQDLVGDLLRVSLFEGDSN